MMEIKPGTKVVLSANLIVSDYLRKHHLFEILMEDAGDGGVKNIGYVYYPADFPPFNLHRVEDYYDKLRLPSLKVYSVGYSTLGRLPKKDTPVFYHIEERGNFFRLILEADFEISGRVLKVIVPEISKHPNKHPDELIRMPECLVHKDTFDNKYQKKVESFIDTAVTVGNIGGTVQRIFTRNFDYGEMEKNLYQGFSASLRLEYYDRVYIEPVGVSITKDTFVYDDAGNSLIGVHVNLYVKGGYTFSVEAKLIEPYD